MVTLKEVVPYGRSMREYIDMFALTDDDLRLNILGCGDGPASFNAEATARQSCGVVPRAAMRPRLWSNVLWESVAARG